MVAPRDLPPLYSWEVLPDLYPALPRPRGPRWRSQRVATFALVALVVLALAFAGILTAYALNASGPGSYLVNGTVFEQISPGLANPAPGALVTLTEEGGSQLTQTTGASGAFAFSQIPPGGIALSITLSGYSPGKVTTFASPVYNAGTTGLAVVLAPSGSGNSTNESLSPFSGLESFFASVDSGVALLGLVAVVGAVAAVLTLRRDRPAVGVVAGGAGLTVPFALYLLALGTPFPLFTAMTTLLAAIGGFTLTLRAVEIAQTSPAPPSD